MFHIRWINTMNQVQLGDMMIKNIRDKYWIIVTDRSKVKGPGANIQLHICFNTKDSCTFFYIYIFSITAQTLKDLRLSLHLNSIYQTDRGRKFCSGLQEKPSIRLIQVTFEKTSIF